MTSDTTRVHPFTTPTLSAPFSSSRLCVRVCVYLCFLAYFRLRLTNFMGFIAVKIDVHHGHDGHEQAACTRAHTFYLIKAQSCARR